MNNVVKNPFREVQKIAEELHDYMVLNEHKASEGQPEGVTDLRKIFLKEDGMTHNDEVAAIVKENKLMVLGITWNGGMNILVRAYEDNSLTLKEILDELLAKKVQFILHNTLMQSVVDEFEAQNWNVTQGSAYFEFNSQGIEAFKKMLRILAEAEYHPTHLLQATANYRDAVLIAKDRMRARGIAETAAKTTNSISAVIMNKMADPVDNDAIEYQIQEAQNKLQNGLVGRTWGWEVEAPNPGSFTSIPGVEAGSDGSVESYETNDQDCECGCRDCTYHSCDCDNCDDYNEDPDHCRDSDCWSNVSYEFRTVGGINRILHPGLKSLLEQIGNTEKNETAGTHIHVYARDLDAFQIGVVLGGYALTQKVWDVLAGRNAEDDQRCRTYANVIPAENVSYTLRTKKLQPVGKFTAINTLNVTSDRGTLEFRQMNCNYDFKRISLMAFMARGLVEVAKRGAKLAEFIHINDLNGLIKLYKSYGYTYETETETIENPHGSRYNQSRIAPQLA